MGAPGSFGAPRGSRSGRRCRRSACGADSGFSSKPAAGRHGCRAGRHVPCGNRVRARPAR
eukprot:1760435-Lingulodinium_polyedra.AAC.1